MIYLSFIFCVLTLACSAFTNDRPIIGVLTQDCPFRKGAQYIAAGYVKWVEGGGARVVPLKYDMEGLEETLKYINGVLLPGGGASFEGKYWDALVRIFEDSVKSYEEGNSFPLWGTCLGFEELICVGARNASILDGGYDSEDLALPLKLESRAGMSRYFTDMTETMMKEMELMNVTYNNHEMGITPKTFSTHSALGKLFDVLSTNTDRKGKPFISMIEGHVYPMWGTQWDPEKVSFEWDNELAIPHSSSAIRINMYPATFFVDQMEREQEQVS